MKTLKSFVLLFAAFLLVSQSYAGDWSFGTVRVGSGKVVKEKRDVASFNAISASSGINVFIFQSNEEKVVVEADDNLMDLIITEVKGGNLKCYIDGSIKRSKKMNVYVSFKTINKVSASAGSDLYSETLVDVPELDVKSSSGSDVKLEIKVNNLSADANSGSDIVLVGSCNQFTASANSGSDINAQKLTAEEAKVNVSSAGDVSISVNKSIVASASSGGDIVYYGNPSVKNIHKSSGGGIHGK